ncbi:MAG: EAL domain-containing protein, partial [Ruminococcus sp.]|nr:EAL domain-containing protein [Ruminococcus sp.]
MKNEKRTKNRKKYFKLRKRHLWFPITITVVIGLLSVLFLELFISSQYSYVADMRIRSEYEFVDIAAKSYMGNDSSDGQPFDILERSGRSYVLLDENGNVKEQFGNNTLGEMNYEYEDYYSSSVVEAGDIEDARLFKVWIYNDTENNILVTDHGETDLNIRKIGKEVRKGLYSIFSEGDSDSDSDLIKQELKLPLWMRYDLDNGEQLFVKIAIAINFSDIIYLFLLLFLENLLLVLVIIVMIIYTVSSFLSHRKMTRVFFTDLATKGHNRIWFLLKGDQVLQKRRNARKCFAVVDLSLVNYRIYCACHSIEEGEELICRIYDAIKAKISKKELCAHFNDGNFALLLMYEEANDLKNRIEELLKTLENVDTEHTFPFHIGVTFIPPVEGGGMFVRRKTVDIEKDYNNASAAKASLDDTVGSAIAYFDDKLIEDQRWSETVTELQQKAFDNEEFVVYYQPKYDPRSNELRGAEALIRWQSPEHGFITPYRFIPIFEKNGFITEIDHYMLEHVAKDQRRWLDQGYKCV